MQAIQESIALMSQFEASAARVAFVLNESTTAANNLVSSTQRIGAGYGISPSANGDAAIRISQVTGDPGEQYKLAADGAKLAMLSGDNYGASVDNLIRIQRSFNLSLADTPQILDTIATIYKSTPSSIQEITQLLERLGPIAEATGMSMEQIGILAARTAQVSGASLGGVDNLFSRVQTNLDTKSVQKSLFDMGIGVTDAEGQVRPFLTVMSEVKAKIDELRASGQDTAALDIAAAIAGKRPEVLREFLVMLDQVNQKTPPLASANDLVAKSVDTLDIKVKTLTADWGIFLETVGNSQGLKAAADNLDLLVRMGIAEQEAINKGLNPIHSGIPGMPDEEHYRAVVAQQMRDDYNAAHPLPFGPGLAGVYTGGPSTLGNQAPPPATYEQNLVNTGILSASRLKEVNTQAITESEYAKLLQYSVARSSIEVGLWRDKLTSMGVIGKAQDDAIQKLKDQLAGASVEFNVNGTPRLATGAPAAYAQEGFSQMNNTGFQKLPIDSGNEDLFRTLMEKYRVQLEGLGLTQEGKPTVVGIEGAAGTPGEGILQRLDKMVIFQDAANLALQAIEKNTRPAISGVYNFPSGETPFVPLSSFELDRQTRAGMLSTATGGVDTKIFDGLTAGFNAPISDLKGAGTLFDGAVKGFSASALLIAAALQARAAVEAAGRQPVVDAAKTASDYLQLYGIGPNAGSFVPGTGKGTSNMGDMPLPPGRGPGLPSPLPVSVNWSNTTYVNIDSETIRTIVENKVIELMSTPDAQSGRGMY
jgi:TP901 family phage tail tape measure protein